MSDLRDVLDREARRIDGAPNAWEAMVRRAARRRTARRVGTAMVALAVAVGGSLVAFRALGPTADVRPATAPETMTAEIAGVSIDSPTGWTVLDVRVQQPSTGAPVWAPVLEILNVEAQICPEPQGAVAAGSSAVFLQVREVAREGTPPGIWPEWPVLLEAEEQAGLSCGPDHMVLGSGHRWTAGGRHFSAILGVGPSASRADVEAAVTAFASLRFRDGWGPYLEFSAGPRQVVSAGPGWIASAFEAAHGEFCLQVEGERIRGDTVGAACEFTITPRAPLDFSVKAMDDGRVAFGAVTSEASRVVVNGVEARIATPLDRYGVEHKVFAAFVPPSSAVALEAFDQAGASIVSAGRTFPSGGSSPRPPVETPEPRTPAEKAAGAFVEEFGAARIDGADTQALRGFLSDEVHGAYVEGRAGLSLYEEPGVGSYVSFEVTHVEEVSVGEHVVMLGMSVEAGSCLETFYEELVVWTTGEEALIVEASRPGVASSECAAEAR